MPDELTTTAYAEPQPEWLPLHVAQFRFLPGFVRTELEFADQIKSLIFSFGEDNQIEIDIEGFAIITEKDGLRLRIDTESAQLSLEAIDDPLASVTNGMDDPMGLPQQFMAALAAVEFVPRHKAAGDALAQVARRLLASLLRRFQLALNDGTAQLYGRWRSIDALFTRVLPDQLNDLVADMEEAEPMFGEDVVVRSVLRSRETSGAVVYAPYVRFAKPMRRSKGSEAEKRATASLVNEIRAAPDRPRKRADVKAEYVKGFGLSSNSFDSRVWPDALEQVSNNNWGKAGRRAGSRNKRPNSKVISLRRTS